MSEQSDTITAPQGGPEGVEQKAGIISRRSFLRLPCAASGWSESWRSFLFLAGNELFVPASAILILVWVRLSRTPWPEIGYVRPRSWIGSIFVGTVFGSCFQAGDEGNRYAASLCACVNPSYHF
jgi:hypothetical protein